MILSCFLNRWIPINRNSKIVIRKFILCDRNLTNFNIIYDN